MDTLTKSNPTFEEYVEQVRGSGLIDESQLTEIERKFRVEGFDPSTSIARFGETLIRSQLLTPWQHQNLLAGKQGFFLGKYTLLNQIGSGGMGTVYLAEHRLMRRRVAIKVLPASKLNHKSYFERFVREAQAIAGLDHPNIIHVYSIDNQKQTYYMVLEYIEGASLDQLVREHGPLPFALAVDYIRQIADGLAHAHSRNMIHRDIKPSNVLVDASGTVKILDLGLARTTLLGEPSLTIKHDEQVLGTVDYLAPEQALDSHAIDERADLYGLGCTLYFLLTGHPPFPNGTVAERLIAHQSEEPLPIWAERPDTPKDLVAICRKLMAKKPRSRFQSAAQVSQALSDWGEVHSVSLDGDTRCGSWSETNIQTDTPHPQPAHTDLDVLSDEAGTGESLSELVRGMGGWPASSIVQRARHRDAETRDLIGLLAILALGLAFFFIFLFR